MGYSSKRSRWVSIAPDVRWSMTCRLRFAVASGRPSWGQTAPERVPWCRCSRACCRPLAARYILNERPIRDWAVRERARLLTWLGQASSSEGDIAAHEIVRLGRLPHYGLLGTPSAADEAAVTAALNETEALAFAPRRLNELSEASDSGCYWPARSQLARRFCCWTNPLCIWMRRISADLSAAFANEHGAAMPCSVSCTT